MLLESRHPQNPLGREPPLPARVFPCRFSLLVCALSLFPCVGVRAQFCAGSESLLQPRKSEERLNQSTFSSASSSLEGAPLRIRKKCPLWTDSHTRSRSRPRKGSSDRQTHTHTSHTQLGGAPQDLALRPPQTSPVSPSQASWGLWHC